MRKIFICVLIASVILTAIPAQATQLGMDKRAVYDDAMAYIVLVGNYEKALELFELLGSYADSPNWRLYCMGMIAIQTANELEAEGYINNAREEIERAISYFEFLSPIDFNGNSANLYTYCNARLDEYSSNGVSQSALDKYAKLVGTEDSMDRYLRLMKGEVLPTQAPYTVALSTIPASAESNIETLWGPGKKYMRQEIVQVNQTTLISICGKENDYYLLEIQTDQYTLRCWALTRKIKPDISAKIPWIGENGWKSTLSKTVEAYYGPGQQYLQAPYILNEGTVVTAYESEGLYTMIEYLPDYSGKPVRLWVPSNALSK